MIEMLLHEKQLIGTSYTHVNSLGTECDAAFYILKHYIFNNHN